MVRRVFAIVIAGLISFGVSATTQAAPILPLPELRSLVLIV